MRLEARRSRAGQGNGRPPQVLFRIARPPTWETYRALQCGCCLCSSVQSLCPIVQAASSPLVHGSQATGPELSNRTAACSFVQPNQPAVSVGRATCLSVRNELTRLEARQVLCHSAAELPHRLTP